MACYESTEAEDIAISEEFESDLADSAAEEEVELAIQIEGAGGFNRVGLHLAVGQGGKVLFFACYTLHVNGNDTFVGEDNGIPNCLESRDDVLALDQERGDFILLPRRVNGHELKKTTVLKINHSTK